MSIGNNMPLLQHGLKSLLEQEDECLSVDLSTEVLRVPNVQVLLRAHCSPATLDDFACFVQVSLFRDACPH